MMNAAPLHATWMAVSPQLLCNIAKREREEQEMSNIIAAISRTIEPRVQQAAQRTATDNRAQIAREIEAAKDPEKLKELVNRYILDAPRNQKTPGDRLQSPANSENVVPQGPGGFGARPNNPYSRLELLAEKGHLKPGETYPLSFSTGQEKLPHKNRALAMLSSFRPCWWRIIPARYGVLRQEGRSRKETDRVQANQLPLLLLRFSNPSALMASSTAWARMPS